MDTNIWEGISQPFPLLCKIFQRLTKFFPWKIVTLTKKMDKKHNKKKAAVPYGKMERLLTNCFLLQANCLQCLFQIADNILIILQTHRKAEESIGETFRVEILPLVILT